MRRNAENSLISWKNSPRRKPLILRGARQVGKTYLIKEFGKTFETFVTLNFEETISAHRIFEQDLDPHRILRDLSILTGKDIIPGKTLLFLDETQIVPNAITALRYFYEQIPDLHVIAAGSLIDFALASIGIPVGRVSFLYLYPMSFMEFLDASGQKIVANTIRSFEWHSTFSTVAHTQLLSQLALYMAIGGMPEAVQTWITTQSLRECQRVHSNIVQAYRQDFEKYVTQYQLKYTNIVFDSIPVLLSQKIKYSNMSSHYQSRELAPCFELLAKAGIIHPIYHSSANRPPIGAGINPKHFKAILMDVALSQSILNLDLGEWLLDPLRAISNKGPIIEAFVGQELLAYADPEIKTELTYWQRESPGSQAEIDYLIQQGERLIPIEVKSDITGGLKSLIDYIKTKNNGHRGIHFSSREYRENPLYTSMPLYFVSKLAERESFGTLSPTIPIK